MVYLNKFLFYFTMEIVLFSFKMYKMHGYYYPVPPGGPEHIEMVLTWVLGINFVIVNYGHVTVY